MRIVNGLLSEKIKMYCTFAYKFLITDNERKQRYNSVYSRRQQNCT